MLLVAGHGNYYVMDDANLPSLLAMPYFGYLNGTDPLYLATRKTILSDANPWFFNGSATSGIGGPHIGLGSESCPPLLPPPPPSPLLLIHAGSNHLFTVFASLGITVR